jgi:hypothetical protein
MPVTFHDILVNARQYGSKTGVFLQPPRQRWQTPSADKPIRVDGMTQRVGNRIRHFSTGTCP